MDRKKEISKLSESEKNRILSEFIKNQITFRVNFYDKSHLPETHSIFDVKPLFNSFDKKIYLKQDDFSLEIKVSTEVMVQFHWNNELYLFKTLLMRDTTSLYFDTQFDLHHIQRRDNFRMSYPESIQSSVDIFFIENDKKFIFKGKIVDLSLTGLKAIFNEPLEDHLKIARTTNIKLSVFSMNKREFQAELVHKERVTSNKFSVNEEKFQYGFKFINISLEQEKSILSCNMELYRNFLSKVSTN
ncbi:MAG: PilZ domain-containing protein [Bdellovibrionaceae bacterium]|nr:PilZ domain-containing protein [Pseudobdellovibrionaceae bacterium]NUM59517.1 PilZ domain-containing protein [Pseudobdellovibrionaceae bacterium]